MLLCINKENECLGVNYYGIKSYKAFLISSVYAIRTVLYAKKIYFQTFTFIFLQCKKLVMRKNKKVKESSAIALLAWKSSYFIRQ